MELEEKYRIEREKWDRAAYKAESHMVPVRDGWDFLKYCQGKIELTGIAEFFGDLRGKKVLEIGCATGFHSILLARSGAQVKSFDISPESIRVAKERAQINNLSNEIEFQVAVCEHMPYEDESFDIVFGKGVLHHLEADPAAFELYRVMKKGAKAAFSEPLGMNPILTFFREYVPYKGKNEHGADRPLNYDDIRNWSTSFEKVQWKEVQLMSMMERGFGHRTEFKTLRRLDDVLLQKIPSLRRYCRYVVMMMQK